jgi:hypothetical protein
MNQANERAAAPKTLPAVKREYLWLLNKYDAWTLLDWSAHPSAKLADLLALPTWECIKKHGL